MSLLELAKRLQDNHSLLITVKEIENAAAFGCKLTEGKEYKLSRSGLFSEYEHFSKVSEMIGYELSECLYVLQDDVGSMFMVVTMTCQTTGQVGIVISNYIIGFKGLFAVVEIKK